MIFEYIHHDNSREIVEFPYKQDQNNNLFRRVDFENKKEFIVKFITRYSQGEKIVLFDKNHQQLLKYYEEHNINDLEAMEQLGDEYKLLFFTSGSTGFPIGAFKSLTNIESEVEVLSNLVSSVQKINKIIVTVPFIHIYGILAGLLLPMKLHNIKLVVKEDFLPYEILEESKEEGSLVITTPVFIKALAKLSENSDLSKALFISSTGPLQANDVNDFEQKYKTKLMQLFGSTETGGIAYKFSSTDIWRPLEGVDIKTVDDKLSVTSPFISQYILDNGIKKLKQPFITEDIVEISDKGFRLLGRSNKIIKIAGKRISAIAIENLLESIDGVERAVVELVYKKELLRSEQILITLQTKIKIDKKTIKEKINECYGVLTIPFKIVLVDEIKLSAMGKKILF